MPFYVSMGRHSMSSLSTNLNPSYHYVSPDGGNVWKGPRKICCFCTLAIVFPALLISVPLLMRFVLYGTSLHFLNPSDMKILDSRISTTWCQGETVRINTTFTAYLTEGEPSLIDEPTHLTLDRNLIIPDDHKEYWGFYLLKGSKFKIRTCGRWRGGTLLVVQGENHLEHCAYIGESDSAGNSDEVSASNSFELDNEILQPNKMKTYSQEELDTILTKIRFYVKSNPKNYGVLKKHLSEWLLIEKEEYEKRKAEGDDETDFSTNSPLEKLQNILDENEPNTLFPTLSPRSQPINSITTEENANATILGISHKNFTEILNSNSSAFPLALLINSVETGTLRKGRREAEIRRKTESGENGAFEDDTLDRDDDSLDSLAGVVHPRMNYMTSVKPKYFDWPSDQGHHTGVLNDTFGDVNDGSDSESVSSFSSSEEALKKCEGVLATFNIIRDDNCEALGSYEDLDIYPDGGDGSNSLHVTGTTDEFLPYYEDIVNVSGYYYFIFGSENEKRDNFIRAKFELDKSEYHLPEPLKNCTNVKECHVDFKFASSEKVVVKIPRPAPQMGGYYWEHVYLAETECHPRTHLYMIFAFMVPLVILLCAFQ